MTVTIDISESECKTHRKCDEIKLSLRSWDLKECDEDDEKQQLQWIERFLCKIKQTLNDKKWQEKNDLYFYNCNNCKWDRIKSLDQLTQALNSSNYIPFAIQSKNDEQEEKHGGNAGNKHHKITINAVETMSDEAEFSVNLPWYENTSEKIWFDGLEGLLGQINGKLKDKQWQETYTIHKYDKALNGRQTVLHQAVNDIMQLVELIKTSDKITFYYNINLMF